MASALDRTASLPNPVVYSTVPARSSENPPRDNALSISGVKSPSSMWTVSG